MQLVKVLAAVGMSAVAATEIGQIERAFEDFVQRYQKSFGDADEKATRFEIFKERFLYMEEQNAKSLKYKLAINAFADIAPEEFRSRRFGMSLPKQRLWAGRPHLGTDEYSGAPLPSAIDWSERGAVTPVKDQGSCASCWAFSTTGALEGAWAIASGQLVALSEQQLVDCSTENFGCNGGHMDTAFTYAERHGLCSGEGYPYEAAAGTCQDGNCSDVVIPNGRIAGFKDVPVNDMQALMEAVAQQPVSVAIEADQSAFQMYSEGILSGECGTNVDHGVLLVGYGEEEGTAYWKVKNSWGPDWGEGGYVRMVRGQGECGILTFSSYPVISADLVV